MQIKIIEIYENKNTQEKQFILDLDGQKCVVWCDKKEYLQIPNIPKEFSDEENKQISEFVKEFLKIIKEENLIKT